MAFWACQAPNLTRVIFQVAFSMPGPSALPALLSDWEQHILEQVHEENAQNIMSFSFLKTVEMSKGHPDVKTVLQKRLQLSFLRRVRNLKDRRTHGLLGVSSISSHQGAFFKARFVTTASVAIRLETTHSATERAEDFEIWQPGNSWDVQRSPSHHELFANQLQSGEFGHRGHALVTKHEQEWGCQPEVAPKPNQEPGIQHKADQTQTDASAFANASSLENILVSMPVLLA